MSSLLKLLVLSLLCPGGFLCVAVLSAAVSVSVLSLLDPDPRTDMTVVLLPTETQPT